MEGISYIVNDKDKKIAAIVDLEMYGELWEDIEDILLAESRKNEETVPWEQVKEELKKEGKL